MQRIVFVCHGNICRSPMAQSVMTDLVQKAGQAEEFVIHSAAVSTEELGNPVHRGTQRVLAAHGVPCVPHRATQIQAEDYARYDHIIGMDSSNLRGILRRLGGDPEKKVSLLLDFTTDPRDIADPWYTGDFEATYRDVCAGCEALLRALL